MRVSGLQGGGRFESLFLPFFLDHVVAFFRVYSGRAVAILLADNDYAKRGAIRKQIVEAPQVMELPFVEVSSMARLSMGILALIVMATKEFIATKDILGQILFQFLPSFRGACRV